MTNPFYIFRIKRSERWVALGALLYSVLLNAMIVCAYWEELSSLTGNFRKTVIKTFHISGFDPLSYLVLTDWSAAYNIYRHPLLAFFMWPLYALNQGLIALTGHNCSTVIMAVLLVFCCVYTAVFLFRILREVIGLGQVDSSLLTLLFFSFGYIMVTVSVPDHFGLSMLMLTLTLYVAGKKMRAHHLFTKWQTVLFFILTAGISLNNGIKVFLANLFVNGKKFFRPANLLLAVIIPSALIWLFARWEWQTFEKPNYLARQEKKAEKAKQDSAKILKNFRDTTSIRDSAQIAQAVNKIIQGKVHAKYVRDHKKAWNLHAGKPINKTEFGKWTDISTPRGWSFVENLFGESLQLHQDHLLQDVLVNRPVIVHYRWVWNYVVEVIVLLLFLAGIVCGWRSRFLWLALSFFGFDMMIHFVLGFGLNEVYIMSAHWLMVIPIAVAYLFRRLQATTMDGGRTWGSYYLWPMRGLVLALALYLLVWNGILYVSY